jgi:DNA polymerase-3 subunit beta
MEIRINRDVLYNGVHKVQGIAETKGAMPILAHLLLTAEKGGISIQATDLEIGMRGFYPANVIAVGGVALNAKKLFDILRELPEEEVHLTKEENHWVSLKCGKSKFRLPGLPPEEFPTFPDYGKEPIMEFSGAMLREMIRKTQFAASPDETRQALSGLLLESADGRACMVGTDGHRLAFISRPLLKSETEKGQTHSFLLPRKTLTELLKLVEDAETTFAFSVKDNHLAFLRGRDVIVSRKIEGKFPNYRQVIPKDNTVRVTVKKETLLHALRRVSLLADEKSKMVRFEMREGSLTLASDGTEQGDATEELTVSYKGEDVSIGLNARYLLDILNVVEQDEVSLNLKDQNHSCLVTVESDKDYLGIVMPMRL